MDSSTSNPGCLSFRLSGGGGGIGRAEADRMDGGGGGVSDEVDGIKLGGIWRILRMWSFICEAVAWSDRKANYETQFL